MGLIGSGSYPWKHLRTLKLGAEIACRLTVFCSCSRFRVIPRRASVTSEASR